MRRGRATIWFALATVLAFVGCERQNKEPSNADIVTLSSGAEILVGEISSMTGSEATFGISTHNAIMMAVDQVNDAGGINGRKIRIILEDDRGDADQVEKSAEKLIGQNKVVALLGEVASSRSLRMAPVAQANNVPMITPSSTHPSVTEIGDYIFRVCFTDPFQGPAMARFAYEVAQVKKVAILRDIKSEYSRGLARFFKEKFVELGGQVVAEEAYSSHDLDFKSGLAKIREAKPDLLYLPGYYSDVAMIMRQSREMGIEATFAGGDGWDSEKLFEVGGDAVEGSYYSTHYSIEAKDPVLQKFVRNYRKRYRALPDALAALAYDAASVLFAAMKRVDEPQGEKLRDAIAATKDYPGVTGRITIDENRNAVKPAVIVTVRGGRRQYLQTIKP